MARVKVSEYIASFLVENGREYNFTVTGGGAMHLNDALGHKKGLSCIYNNHEQACAIAAEAYTRLTGKLACVCVTSGPGGTNAITGVLGGWLDSIPMFILSGQVKRELTIDEYPDSGLRQLGDQEFCIQHVAQNFTKYCVMVHDANDIAYHLEKAVFLAQHGRGGPVWLDIPLDIQGAMIETEELRHFSAEELSVTDTDSFGKEEAHNIMSAIRRAKAPILLVGNGVRYAKAQTELLAVIEKIKIPVITAWGANDLLSSDNPYAIGIPGTLGTRAANFVVQNADLMLVLGCRMNIRMVGYTKGDFGKNAYKIMVDIDRAELEKPTFVPDWKICADVKEVLSLLAKEEYHGEHGAWLKWCKDLQAKYPVVLPQYRHAEERINPYVFTEKLFQIAGENDVIVCSNGSACVMPIQVNNIKNGQRLICNSGCAAMGYGLPAAIGAANAYPDRRIICLEGDGSIMMNIQELATVGLYHWNIKIFIINNNGYHSIRQTQRNNFGEPLVGVNRDSGVGLPRFERIADAFEIPYYKIDREDDADRVLSEVMAQPSLVICEAYVDEKQFFAPKSSSKVLGDGRIVSPSIDEMSPFLADEEYRSVRASWIKEFGEKNE